jgi:hypothetical protein
VVLIGLQVVVVVHQETQTEIMVWVEMVAVVAEPMA